MTAKQKRKIKVSLDSMIDLGDDILSKGIRSFVGDGNLEIDDDITWNHRGNEWFAIQNQEHELRGNHVVVHYKKAFFKKYPSGVFMMERQTNESFIQPPTPPYVGSAKKESNEHTEKGQGNEP